MALARLSAILAVAALVAIGGVFGASALAPFGAEQTQTQTPEPTLTSFNSTDAVCIEGIHQQMSTQIQSVNGNTTVNLSGNVSVPDANYVLNTTGLVEEESGTYSLNITANETDDPAQNCTAQASYSLNLSIPPTDDPITLTVRYEDEVLTTIRSEGGSISMESSQDS